MPDAPPFLPYASPTTPRPRDDRSRSLAEAVELIAVAATMLALIGLLVAIPFFALT